MNAIGPGTTLRRHGPIALVCAVVGLAGAYAVDEITAEPVVLEARAPSAVYGRSPLPFPNLASTASEGSGDGILDIMQEPALSIAAGVARSLEAVGSGTDPVDLIEAVGPAWLAAAEATGPLATRPDLAGLQEAAHAARKVADAWGGADARPTPSQTD